jgi:hypothetical protein
VVVVFYVFYSSEAFFFLITCLRVPSLTTIFIILLFTSLHVLASIGHLQVKSIQSFSEDITPDFINNINVVIAAYIFSTAVMFGLSRIIVLNRILVMMAVSRTSASRTSASVIVIFSFLILIECSALYSLSCWQALA